MTTDYRDMCAELVDDLEMSDWPSKLKEAFRADIARARTLLAQPVAEGPTDEDLEDLAEVMNVSGNPVPAMRRALELWGRPTPQPVPTSERPWERDGWCDAEGRCYGWDGDYWWMVSNPGTANETITHWLPANALPTPEATND